LDIESLSFWFLVSGPWFLVPGFCSASLCLCGLGHLSLVTCHSSLVTALMGSPLGSPDDVVSTGRAVRDMFAAVVPRYDFLNHFLSLGCDIAWRKATATALRDVLARPDSVAVDVCCGTGDLALELARVSRGAVIGTDFCHPMLRSAVDKAARQPLRARVPDGRGA